MARLPDYIKVFDFLKSVSPFVEVDEKLLSDFIRQSTIWNYRKGAIIVNQDDETDAVYFIYSGKVRFYLDDDQGHEITLNTLIEGQYFGEFALLSN
jgi:CRP/FNR family transcriptional regulator, cyclic AMP receptor protein